MKFSRADSRVKMFRFSDISGTNSVTILSVCWWFVRTETDDSVFGATKPPAHPEGGDGDSYRNVGKHSHLDAAVCPRKFIEYV